MNCRKQYTWLLLVLLLCCKTPASAQQTVAISDSSPQHLLVYNEISCLVDSAGNYTLQQVMQPAKATQFRPVQQHTPVVRNTAWVYWYRFRIRPNPVTRYSWLIECFDQTIDHLQVFAPGTAGQYQAFTMGDVYPFQQRLYRHKNFLVPLNMHDTGTQVYYVRIQTSSPANVLLVLRTEARLLAYGLTEYFLFGIGYGMILLCCLYNLILFFSIRQVQYLYYVLYNVCIALYTMSIDGIAFQYLWPSAPGWNQHAYGTALFGASLFALLFARHFLQLERKNRRWMHVLHALALLRTVGWIVCLFYPALFTYKYVDLLTVTLLLYCGICRLKQGYRPARYFVVGYAFLFAGACIKALIALEMQLVPTGPFTHYSLSIGFLLELVFISLALGDRIRLLKKNKDRLQQQMIGEVHKKIQLQKQLAEETRKAHILQLNQLQYQARLQEQLNQELETKVAERTREVRAQAALIEQQNTSLLEANRQLQQQACEIERMNALLTNHNRQLQHSVEKVTRARALNEQVSFEEFSKTYPDEESCYRFLAQLKWERGYQCRKCGHGLYYAGHTPFSRRCRRCLQEESAMAHTIFQNSRVPLNKAFYLTFLVYATKGQISSHKLSAILGIRQNTCLSYSNRIKQVMENRKKEVLSGERGWLALVLE
jgi:hypothetical protein